MLCFLSKKCLKIYLFEIKMAVKDLSVLEGWLGGVYVAGWLHTSYLQTVEQTQVAVGVSILTTHRNVQPGTHARWVLVSTFAIMSLSHITVDDSDKLLPLTCCCTWQWQTVTCVMLLYMAVTNCYFCHVEFMSSLYPLYIYLYCHYRLTLLILSNVITYISCKPHCAFVAFSAWPTCKWVTGLTWIQFHWADHTHCTHWHCSSHLLL